MSDLNVLLPLQQNWSCHNCGGCCREHEISISDAEKQRIEKQNWTVDHGIPGDRPLIVALGNGWRLNHQEDGACVFLDANGLCRIHAKFGEPAKPLACRLYPYAIHPAANGLTVSLRFSCPSVVSNLGTRVTAQRAELEQLCREVVPTDFRNRDLPVLAGKRSVSWEEFRVLLAFLERGLADRSIAFPQRLLQTLAWTQFLEQADQGLLSDERLPDILTILLEAARRACVDGDYGRQPPSRTGRMMFRQLVAQLLRHDTQQSVSAGWKHRLRMLSSGLRLTFGRGKVPALKDPESVRAAFGESASGPAQSVLFAAVEQFSRELPSEADELFERYFLVKIAGHHFFGRAFYDYSMLDGLRTLALMFPATIWTARLRALQSGRDRLLADDLRAALAILDHNLGYSPALQLRSSRSRIRQLAVLQQIESLCRHYGGVCVATMVGNDVGA